MSARRLVTLLALGLMTLFTVAADAQLTRVGVVATLQGSATLTRAATPQGVPLRPRDDLFVADRIVTGDHTLARILLGGKAVVTVRERSALTISESANTATLDVSGGKIALAVVKERMKAGEQIDIRTPNAVAGIRGTVVITEVSQATAQAGEAAPGVTTTITVLTGTVEVRQLDALTRQPVGVGVLVTAAQAIRITGAAPPRPLPVITPDTRQRLSDEFKLTLKDAPAPPSADHLQQTTNALRGPVTPTTSSSVQPGGTSAPVSSGSSSGPSGTTPATSQPSPAPSGQVTGTPIPSLSSSASSTSSGPGSGSSSGSDAVTSGDSKSGSGKGSNRDSFQRDLNSLQRKRK